MAPWASAMDGAGRAVAVSASLRARFPRLAARLPRRDERRTLPCSRSSAARSAGPAGPSAARRRHRSTVAELPAILAAVKAPGAKAVLVNVWATWCEPCREELPDLLRFYREQRGAGLRLVMVSADDEDSAPRSARVLRRAPGFDGPAFIKRGDDMTFINASIRSWSGAMPATLLYDGARRAAAVRSARVDGAALRRTRRAASRRAPTPGEPMKLAMTLRDRSTLAPPAPREHRRPDAGSGPAADGRRPR